MPFYHDLSGYQTLASRLKQSTIDPDFVQLYDDIYTNLDSDQGADITQECKWLDVLIYLLIEAYDQNFPLAVEQGRSEYQDYFSGLLDAKKPQNDAELTFRHMLFDAAIFLRLNHFISTNSQFSSQFLSAQCPGEKKGLTNRHHLLLEALKLKNHTLLSDQSIFSNDFFKALCPGADTELTNRHLLLITAASQKNNRLLSDKALFCDEFLNAPCPGADEGWTNRHLLMREAVTFKNNTLLSTQSIFSNDFLNAQCPGAHAGWSHRHQMMLDAVRFENNTLFSDKTLFCDDFFNAQLSGEENGWSNRHQLLITAVEMGNNTLLSDQSLLSDNFLNAPCPGTDDKLTNRYQAMQEALATGNHDFFNHSFCFGKTRQSASQFLQNLSEQDQKVLYSIRGQTLEQKIKNKPGTENIMAVTLQRIQAILDKTFPEKNKHTDSKKQSLLATMKQKLKSYTIDSAIMFKELIAENAYYIEGENESYGAEELQAALKPKGLSPFTRLLVTADDIQYGFAPGDLKDLVTQCSKEYEKKTQNNKRKSSILNLFSNPAASKKKKSAESFKQEKNDEDHADDVKKNMP